MTSHRCAFKLHALKLSVSHIPTEETSNSGWYLFLCVVVIHMEKLIPLLGDQFVSCAKQGLSEACTEAFPANNLEFHLLLAHPRST